MCVWRVYPKWSHEPVIDPRSPVACTEDQTNKITTLQTRRGDLATDTTNTREHLKANARHSKFVPLQYFTAGVTQYFHTMKREACEWVPQSKCTEN